MLVFVPPSHVPTFQTLWPGLPRVTTACVSACGALAQSFPLLPLSCRRSTSFRARLSQKASCSRLSLTKNRNFLIFHRKTVFLGNVRPMKDAAWIFVKFSAAVVTWSMPMSNERARSLALA
jgi:hypothetical protein